MTEFEDRDDYGAEEIGAVHGGGVGEDGAREDGAEEIGAEARELFARTAPGAGGRPRLAFTAEDLVRVGRRRVQKRDGDSHRIGRRLTEQAVLQP